jgi:signal transduction histidine kinase
MQILMQTAALKARNLQTVLLLLTVVSLVIIVIISVKRHIYKQKLLKEIIVNSENEKKIAKIFAGIKGEEKERVRIARELHDGVVSEVLALKLNLKAMELQFNGIKNTDNFRNALVQSEEIALKLRQTAHNMMPIQLTEQGLYNTIGTFLKRISNGHIHFTYQCYGNLPSIKVEVDKIILLMVLELIQNIIKHAKASEAIVQFSYIDDVLSITVEDNGVGITSSETMAVNHESFELTKAGVSTDTNHQQKTMGEEGIGLNNVKENVALLTGTFDIRTSAYKGTTILIEIPMTKHLQQPYDSHNVSAIEHKTFNTFIKHSDHEN